MRTTDRRRMSSAPADDQPVEGVEEGQLRKLLTNTINTIEDNKTQIFDIYENTRREVEGARRRLLELKEHVAATIERVDALTAEEQQAKRRLAEVSEKFTEYTEDEIRKTYEAVSIIQINLARKSSPCVWNVTSLRYVCAILAMWLPVRSRWRSLSARYSAISAHR